MELTEWQHEQLQIAMEHLESIARNSKERNQYILIGVLVQGFCWITVVYLIALYVFQLAP